MMGPEADQWFRDARLPDDLLTAEIRQKLLATGNPVLLLAADGRSPLWSSDAAARALGFSGAKALLGRRLPDTAPGAQYLVELAQKLEPGEPATLVRLRFFVGFRREVLSALCEAIRLGDGKKALLVVFPPELSLSETDDSEDEIASDAANPGDPRRSRFLLPSRVTPSTLERADLGAIVAAGGGAMTPPRSEPSRPIEPMDVVEIPMVKPDMAEPDRVEADAACLEIAEAELSDAAAGPAIESVAPPRATSAMTRFIFTLAPNGRLETMSPQFGEMTGLGASLSPGIDFVAFLASLDEPAAAALGSALEAGSPFREHEIVFSAAGQNARLRMRLSALPDAPGGGFSGFGRFFPEAVEPTEIPPEIPQDPLRRDPLPQDPSLLEPEAPPIAADDASPESSSPPSPPPVPIAPYRIDPPVALAPDNVVPIRIGLPGAIFPPPQPAGLSNNERHAFREIARALGARFDPTEAGETPAAEPGPARPPPASSPRSEREPASIPAPEHPEDALVPRILLDQLPVGLLIIEGDNARLANRALLDLLGYPDFETFVAEDGPRAMFRKSLRPGSRGAGFDQLVLATRDGEMIQVDAHLQWIEWSGRSASMITFRRASEQEQGKTLRRLAFDARKARSEAQELRNILDTATDGVLTLGEDGTILSLNATAEALFGFSQNEVVGEPFLQLLHNESHAATIAYLEGMRMVGVQSVLNDGREIIGREKKAGRIPLFMTLGRISEEEPRRFCAVLRDLTAWKNAEAELQAARRAAEAASAKKSDFLTKISHEIRTPINAIIGFSEVMEEERLGPIGTPRYKEYLSDIRASGQHVVSLVNDLLDLAKIEAGRLELEFAATDLNAIVISAVAILQPQANANRVLMRTQLAGRMPKVVADERSIRQIVLNMLSNATRYTQSGGQVIVSSALSDKGEAILRIRDTGIGMTPSEIERALEPFEQIDTARKTGGTGLGLPLTRALVEANRAHFAIRSTPGEGTLVEITFPVTRVLTD